MTRPAPTRADVATAGVVRNPRQTLRIAVAPWYVHNRYQQHFYEALHPVVESLRKEIVIRDEWVRAHANDIDVLHFHWPEFVWRSSSGRWRQLRTLAGFWTYLQRARAQGLQVWWTAHNLEPHEGAGLIDTLGTQILARQADLVICHSEWSRQVMQRRFGCPPSRSIRLDMPPSLDVQRLAPEAPDAYRRLFEVPPDVPLFCCVGQIRPYKNLLAAARAVASLPKELDAHLVIAGPPHDRDLVRELESLAVRDARLRIVARRLEDATFAGLVKASDAVLLPYARVTNSSVLSDALCAGRPVVATRHPVFEEMAERAGEAIVFADAPTAAGIATALRRFIEQAPSSRAAAAAFGAIDWDAAVQPLVQRVRASA